MTSDELAQRASRILAGDVTRPITLADYSERILRPAVASLVAREGARSPRPNPLLELLQKNMPPPKPAPWWRRWWWRAASPVGTRLIRWGRALGGDDDD